MTDDARFTHVDERGAARMVDVTGKDETVRTARARGEIALGAEAFTLLRDGRVPKGDVLAAARIAGIGAAKRTWELIPLCHPLPLGSAEIAFALDDARHAVEIESFVKLTGQTGVEMEALTAVAVAALTIYDMCKSVTKNMTIGAIRLVEKTGGKSGDYRATEPR